MKILLSVVKAKIFILKLLGLQRAWKSPDQSLLTKYHFDDQLPADQSHCITFLEFKVSRTKTHCLQWAKCCWILNYAYRLLRMQEKSWIYTDNLFAFSFQNTFCHKKNHVLLMFKIMTIEILSWTNNAFVYNKWNISPNEFQ